MHEIFKTSSYRILEIFIENSNSNFSIREIARLLRKNHATIINHIKHLHKLGMIKIDNKTLYPTYYASTENQYYTWYKRKYIEQKIISSGLIEYLQESTLPDCIILFGSCAKGYYTKKSDIDIFVESNKLDLNLKKYEKKLGKEINVLFEPRITKLNSGLQNNILNGTILYGFVKLDKP